MEDVSRERTCDLFFKPMPINIGTYLIQPHRCTWVVLWLFCFRSAPQHSLIYGPLSRVLFGESLVKRLYSEIDQTYLSIEAQCVSHYYPRWTATDGGRDGCYQVHYLPPSLSYLVNNYTHWVTTKVPRLSSLCLFTFCRGLKYQLTFEQTLKINDPLR